MGSMPAGTLDRMQGRFRIWAVVLLLALLYPLSPARASDVSTWQGPTDADMLLKESSGNWAAPRCIGDGVSGSRVQPVFVYREGQPNRFAEFNTVLRRSMYLTSGIFERSSGGQRAVRWVHDAACQPVIWQVAVPTAYTYNLVKLRSYLTSMYPTFRNSERVYSLWVDALTGEGWSGLGGNRWSATWTSSFGFVWVDTHELVHALGAVHARAPHSTGKGHCWDGFDVMCYSDGGKPWPNKKVCTATVNHYRLDCGQDDYFAVSPMRGSWLARHPRHNVANSKFLARTAPVPLAPLPPAPTNVTRTVSSIDWDVVPGVRYDVGYEGFTGDRVWVVQDAVVGHADLVNVGSRKKIFVRAVSDSGYSSRVVASLR